MAFYSADEFGQYMILNRMRGPYAPIYWIVILFNVVLPQSLWFKRVRLSVGTLFVLSIVVNIGMWLERFMIIVTSLHRDFLPSSWDMFYPTFWDWAILIGSLGSVRLAVPDVRALPAGDLDIRDAQAGAREEGGRGVKTTAPVYGLIAEFADERALVDAARRARAEGYRNIDAYAPFSVEGLSDALGFRKDRVALITLLGGIVGGVGVYFLQWYTAVIDYPINAGGRPLHSWPAFIPATFEMTVLGAALAAFFGMLILNGLPRLNHPIFDAPDFDLASRNRFFLCIEAADPRFDAEQTRRFLDELDPMNVGEVPR